MKFSKPVLIPTLFMASVAHAISDASIYDLSIEQLVEVQLVVAASGFNQQIKNAPATVTVISSKQWQAMGAKNLTEVLNTIVGVHISKPQINFQHTKFMIRGLSGESSARIKLMIDGEPIEYMQDGGLYSGFMMPLTSFERIEVIKGPGSAIYGADAFAGIINLVSYQANKMPAIIGARVGSFNDLDLYGRGEFDIGEGHLQWSFDHSRSDDDKDRIINTDLQTNFDNIFGTSASHAPGSIDEHYKVFSLLTKYQQNNFSMDYFTWHNVDLGLAAGIAQALDPEGSSRVQLHQFNSRYLFDDWVDGSLKATLSYKTMKSESWLKVFPSGAVLPIGADGNLDFIQPQGFTLFEEGYIGTPSQRGYSTTAKLTHLFNANKQHLVRWELGHEQQTFNPTERKNFGPSILTGTEPVVGGELTDISNTPYIYLPNVKRDFNYFSIQDEWRPNEQLQLTLGARYDNYSDFGSTINPRMGLIWHINADFSAKLFAGSAFRAPPINHLYAQNNPVGYGNPTLKPETLDTLESGFNFSYFVSADALITFSLFEYHAKDLIAFAFDSQQQINIAQNVGEQKGRGAEVVLKWKPRINLTVDFNYSYLQSEDQLAQDIQDVPQQMAYASANWQFNPQWQWNIDAKWISERPRAVNDTRPALKSSFIVNSKLTHRDIIDGLDGALIVKNLFDRKVKAPSNGVIADDYPLPGLQLLFELTYKF